MPNGGVISDFNVCVNISHTFVGDLLVEIEHVDTGTTVVLIDRPGYPAGAFGCAGQDIRVYLDDEAAAPVEGQCAFSTPTINGAFRPNASLSAFDGEMFNGTWQVRVIDVDGVGDFVGDVVGVTLFAD
jgi:hypothetical protein